MRRTNMKKLAKTLNQVFSDEKFLNNLAKSTTNVKQAQSFMGHVMTYYIATRDTTPHSYEDLKKLIYTEACRTPLNKQKNESDQEALKRNIIDEGVVTHSFNGFLTQKVKKNGLGEPTNFDKNLDARLIKLENDLGKSAYLKTQTNDASEIYYTSPGTNSIHYAMQQSPERLFLGPLKQKNPLPVIVGEKKEDYYTRVAIDKINKNYRIEEQQPIIDNAQKVINQLCSNKPQIALIPINMKNKSLNARNLPEDEPKPLINYIKEQPYVDTDPMNFFANECFGGSHPSNCSDLFSTGVKIPASEMEFINIPDSFDLSQIIAKQRGLKPGEKFDLKTLKKVEEIQEQPPETEINNKTLNTMANGEKIVEKVSAKELSNIKAEFAPKHHLSTNLSQVQPTHQAVTAQEQPSM